MRPNRIDLLTQVFPEDCDCDFKFINFKHIDILSIQEEKYPRMYARGSHWWVNIGSGNGLVPSGTKPLPEPLLTKISDTIWCHYATMS